MKHMMIPASWKSASAMRKTIENRENENWNVVALGDVSGVNTLILADDGHQYEHEVIQIFWSLKGKVHDIISEKQDEGWIVATLGACLGSTLLILKRKLQRE
ncbi:MAG: hypothetical protein GF388_09005 [Candidatus Aegiribacteria sp.]|nr:hypothetical protein [Candidatus Aegiribacteria sp.]MBD3295199.1 hypothetical protein [Candidatus Fermentibacteria bacterium]